MQEVALKAKTEKPRILLREDKENGIMSKEEISESEKNSTSDDNRIMSKQLICLIRRDSFIFSKSEST